MRPLKSHIALIVIAAIQSLFVSSCATTEQDPKKLYDHGDYDGAELAYKNILKRKPTDVEASKGLTNARLKIIEKRVLSIKKARTQGESTIDMVLDILDLEKNWNLQPEVPTNYLQSDESDRAAAQALIKLNGPLYEGFPLKREAEISRDSRLFKESHSWDYSTLKIRTQTEGKKKCQEFVQKAGDGFPYLNIFITQLCDHWAARHGPRIDVNAMELELAPAVVTRFSLNDFPPDIENQISVKMNDALHDSPWYSSAGGTPLMLSITGTLQSTPTISLNMDGKGEVNHKTLLLSLHDESTLPVPDLREWLSTHLTQLAEQYHGLLYSSWKELYCGPVSLDSFANSGEKAQRCLKLPATEGKTERDGVSSNFIDAWYIKYIGMDRKTTEALLKEGQS